MRLNRATVGYLLAVASAATGAVRFNLWVFSKERAFTVAWFFLGALATGMICTGVHVAVKDGLRRGTGRTRGKWHHALLYGVLMAWSSATHYVSLLWLNETVMSSLAQTSVLVTIGLAVWLLGERFTKLEWAATGVICGGIFLTNTWSDPDRLPGFLLIMSGVLAGAFATIGAKRWVQGIPPRVLMLWRNGIATLVVAAYLVVAAPAFPAVTVATVAACIGAGFLGHYLHGLFFLQALERIDAGKAALMGRVGPIVVFVTSWLWLDRIPEDIRDIWGAGLLVAGAVWLAAARQRA